MCVVCSYHIDVIVTLGLWEGSCNKLKVAPVCGRGWSPGLPRVSWLSSLLPHLHILVPHVSQPLSGSRQGETWSHRPVSLIVALMSLSLFIITNLKIKSLSPPGTWLALQGNYKCRWQEQRGPGMSVWVGWWSNCRGVWWFEPSNYRQVDLNMAPSPLARLIRPPNAVLWRLNCSQPNVISNKSIFGWWAPWLSEEFEHSSWTEVRNRVPHIIAIYERKAIKVIRIVCDWNLISWICLSRR